MIKNIDEIEQSLGLENGKFNELLTSEEEHVIDLNNVVISKKEDYEAKIQNIKKDEEIKGRELLLKEMKEELGLEFEGRKDPNKFIEAFKSKIESEAVSEPEQRFTEMKSKFEQMQTISEDWKTKYSTLEESIKKEKNQSKIDNVLLKEIPDNTKINKEDVLSILKTRNNFDLDDNGNVVVLKNGKPLVNEATLNNLSVSDFMKDFTKPYLKEVEGGRGDSQQQGQAKAGSFEAFEKEMAEKGITGERFNLEMSKRINDKTLTI